MAKGTSPNLPCLCQLKQASTSIGSYLDRKLLYRLLLMNLSGCSNRCGNVCMLAAATLAPAARCTALELDIAQQLTPVHALC